MSYFLGHSIYTKRPSGTIKSNDAGDINASVCFLVTDNVTAGQRTTHNRLMRDGHRKSRRSRAPLPWRRLLGCNDEVGITGVTATWLD